MPDDREILRRALRGGLKTEDPTARLSLGGVDLSLGTVEAVLATRLRVRVGGRPVELPYLETWTPAIGDVVLVARQGAGLFMVLGPSSE